MRRSIAALLVCIPLSACSTFPLMEPRTIGEVNANYDYIPLDPLSVQIAVAPPLADDARGPRRNEERYRRCAPRRTGKNADLMDALPDMTLRMAVEDITGQASLGIAPVSVSADGRQYRVTADSVNTDEVNVQFAVRLGGRDAPIPILGRSGPLPAGERIEIFRILDAADELRATEGNFERFAIPVFVGVGLRLTAAITHRSGKLNVSSLPALTAGVEARRVTGTLTMQSLGVFSQQITSLMQIPTELNAASVQQALVALGAARAVIYDADTGTRPRIVGFANPFRTNDPQLIQMIRSELARRPVGWTPCDAA
jgi:hypothetical protein